MDADFPRRRHFSRSSCAGSLVCTSTLVEQAVNLDDRDEAYNWPWLYAVQVGEWGITIRRRASFANTSCAVVSSWLMTFTGPLNGRCF